MAGCRLAIDPTSAAFWELSNYAVLQKICGNDIEVARRYSPAKIVTSTLEVIKESYVERLGA